MICNIIYSATVTPFIVCFFEIDEVSMFFVCLGYFIDFLFFIDIILNFITPDFDEQDNLIIDL